MNKDDVIKIDVPTFIRLLELAREDIKEDPPIHFVAEIVTRLSQDKVVTMDDYENIINYMNKNKPDELENIRRLGGMRNGL
jgi:hypothetical protein